MHDAESRTEETGVLQTAQTLRLRARDLRGPGRMVSGSHWRDITSWRYENRKPSCFFASQQSSIVTTRAVLLHFEFARQPLPARDLAQTESHLVRNRARAGLRLLQGLSFPASVHSATVDTTGNPPALHEAPGQGRACPPGGSGTAAPAQSNRRPTVQIARSPRRHSPNMSAGAGNACRSAVKTCSGKS